MAERICERLGELGVSAAIGEPAGTSEPSAVLVLWSPSSIAAAAQLADAERGLTGDKLLSCVIGPCSVPSPFDAKVALSLADWEGGPNDPNWLGLVAHLADVLQRPGLFELSHAIAADDPTKKAEFARRYPDEPAAQEIRRLREVKERQAFEHTVAFARAGFDRRMRNEWKKFEAILKVYKIDFEHWLEDERMGAGKPPPQILIEAGTEEAGQGQENEVTITGLADRLAREHARRRELGQQLQSLQRQQEADAGLRRQLTSQAFETASRHSDRTRARPCRGACRARSAGQRE